jgi:pimeloyl-ACP methyl ester carboxylesterase
MKRSAAAALVATAGLAVWEVQRRRDQRAITDDPAWWELRTEIPGRSEEVRSADGTRLHVEVFGPEGAPPIVLVHGWTEAIRLWRYQIRDLSGHFRVIAYDQRGHGRSGPPQALGYTPDAIAEDLAAVLDACVSSGKRAVVAGHSMGGMAIVALASRHPDVVEQRIAAVGLVNTGVQEMQDRTTVLGDRAGRRVNAAILAPLLTRPLAVPRRLDPVGMRLARRIMLGRRASPGRIAFAHEMVLATTAETRAGFARTFIGLDLSAGVPALTVPAAVIAGGVDRLLPTWHSRLLARTLPQVVDYVEIRESGHMSPIEAPDEVTRRLRRLATTYLTGYAGSGPKDGGSGAVSSGTVYTDAGVDAAAVTEDADSGSDAAADGVTDAGRSSGADPMVTVPLTVPPSSTRRREARMSPTNVPDPPTLSRD